MPFIIPILAIIGGGVAIGVLNGFANLFDKTGEGINDASNGLLKIAGVSGVAYFLYKKGKF